MSDSPTWGKVLSLNIESQKKLGHADIDGIRRGFLKSLADLTGRHTILYATRFTSSNSSIPSEMFSIVEEDIQGLMEVVHGAKSKKLDLILHSPGGSIDAAEGIVNYLREKFTSIRVIVPHLA